MATPASEENERNLQEKGYGRDKNDPEDERYKRTDSGRIEKVQVDGDYYRNWNESTWQKNSQ